jgi:hypothetical protein
MTFDFKSARRFLAEEQAAVIAKITLIRIVEHIKAIAT